MDFEDLTRVLGSLKVVGVSVCSSSFPGLGRRWGGPGQGPALCGTTMTNLLLLLVSLFFQPMGFYLGSVGLTQLQRILPNVLVRANFML